VTARRSRTGRPLSRYHETESIHLACSLWLVGKGLSSNSCSIYKLQYYHGTPACKYGSSTRPKTRTIKTYSKVDRRAVLDSNALDREQARKDKCGVVMDSIWSSKFVSLFALWRSRQARYS
jgi:hypothetical protein